MRNGQKRMRGRNHRKSQNPLTRVYESNGPDVKIRGTANHIADKYIQLARDAQSSGDPVAAENYYQHAEHYFRLIAAAQEQLRQNQPQQQQPRLDNDLGEDAGEDDNYSNFGAEPGFAPQPQQFAPREQPQPSYAPREQPQPREYREPRENRQPQIQPQETGAVDRLPSFITGGAPQPAVGLDSNGAPQGERFAHRRRRPRGPRPEGQAPVQESGDIASE